MQQTLTVEQMFGEYFITVCIHILQRYSYDGTILLWQIIVAKTFCIFWQYLYQYVLQVISQQRP